MPAELPEGLLPMPAEMPAAALLPTPAGRAEAVGCPNSAEEAWLRG